jgi:hypothetical protein
VPVSSNVSHHIHAVMPTTEQRSSPLASQWKQYEDAVGTLFAHPLTPIDGDLLSLASIDLTLAGMYELPATVRSEIRAKNSRQWRDRGAKDKANVGIKQLTIDSDAPLRMSISAHVYRWFDFLATHKSALAESTPTCLSEYLLKAKPFVPVESFPNPLGLGLTVYCNSGKTVVVGVRSSPEDDVVGWYGGRLTNGVGENAVREDFTHSELKQLHVLSVLGLRGLREELGLYKQHVASPGITVHLLDWAKDVRDLKFFGDASTDLNEQEVRYRWEHHARDKDTRELRFIDVSTKATAEDFWLAESERRRRWTPELRICLASSLLRRGLLSESVLNA